jgi:transcriptional regulator with XRE-family HTH domain
MTRPLSDVLEETPRKPSDLLAGQISHYRRQRGWSQRDLSNVLAERFDVTIDPATLARLETGQRRITVDEACMFAVALDVPLESLLWPLDESEAVSVAPGVSVAPWQALEWSTGREALPHGGSAAWLEAERILVGCGALRDQALWADDARNEPDEDYRSILKTLAMMLDDARGNQVSTEGIVPAKVLADLEKLGIQAPRRPRRRRSS